MEILRNLDQLYNKISSSLSIEDDLKQMDFVFKIASEQDLTPLATKLPTTLSIDKCKELFSLVFQLNDYTALICNLTHMFLLSKKYNEIHTLVNKIFVAHIGNKFYRSNTATSFNERNFDRFIEIVKTANIANNLVFPFLLTILKSNKNDSYYVWKNPAVEYLQSIFLENEKLFSDFIISYPEFKYTLFNTILQFNTTKGIEYLLKDFFDEEHCDREQNTALLKNYKKETLLYLDGSRSDSFMKDQTDKVKVLLTIDSDAEVKTRIHDIYSNTKNREVKSLISTELAIPDTLYIKTEKQFLYAVRHKIKEPQERSLGLPFDHCHLTFASGSQAGNNTYTFLIYLFKEEKNLFNLFKLKNLETLFDKDSLHDFVEKLFNKLMQKDDILQAKWCVRMFALFMSNTKLNNLFDFLSHLLKLNRHKEARYLINCLIFSHKFEIVDFIKQENEEENLFIKNNLQEFIENISISFSMNEEDVKDILVPNTFSDAEFEHQTNRLFNSFLAGKMYPLPLFNQLFFENSIYNKLAQNLVFGEYRFGRLYNAFVIENKEQKFLVGKSIVEHDADKDADIVIGIIHPFDCDFKFDKVFNYFPNPPFNQFKCNNFLLNDYSPSSKTINRFIGMVFDTAPFLEFITQNGFIPNKVNNQAEYNSIIHLFPAGDILCEVEFQKNMTETTPFNSLGEISFYRISETLTAQDKYITNKTNALPIATLPYRYFDHILAIISEASKK